MRGLCADHVAGAGLDASSQFMPTPPHEAVLRTMSLVHMTQPGGRLRPVRSPTSPPGALGLCHTGRR